MLGREGGRTDFWTAYQLAASSLTLLDVQWLPYSSPLPPAPPPCRQQNSESQQALSAQLEEIAEDIVKQFEAKMGEVMDNLETGEMAFDDLNCERKGEGEGGRACICAPMQHMPPHGNLPPSTRTTHGVNPLPWCSPPAPHTPASAPAALLDSAEGFDLSRGTWRRSGWRELDALREVLEKVGGGGGWVRCGL